MKIREYRITIFSFIEVMGLIQEGETDKSDDYYMGNWRTDKVISQ